MKLSVEGAKDRQLVRSDWTPIDDIKIAGVLAKSITSVLSANGYLTECWRGDWNLDDRGVAQVFQRVLDLGAVSAWHVHGMTTDRLFCASGRLLLALYDARVDSPTHGQVHDFRLGRERPAVVVVPPGVYHGIRNIGSEPAMLINMVDQAYDYEDPDHYRVPSDTPEIPYSIA